MEIGYSLPRAARRSKTGKKAPNRRLLVFSIVAAVLLGSTQVVAAAVLDTNIIDLIKGGVKFVADSQVAHANTESPAIEADYKTQMQSSVTETKNNASNALSQFTQSELTRARDELTAYLNDKKLQMNNVVTPQVDLQKQEITKNMNAIIAAIKQRLDVEFQRQLGTAWQP